MSSQEVDVGGRRLRISTLDRVLYPAAGFTKAHVLDYYARVAPALVPHLAGRPVTLLRCPEGVEAACWYQTQCRGAPEWLRTQTVPGRTGDPQSYCVIDDLPGLVWAANLGALELHPLPVRVDALDEPTALVLDLDPGPPAGLAECCRVALLLRDALAPLECAVKTSGSLGLHVVVPLGPGASFSETKAAARALAETLAARRPDLAVARQARTLRAGKVLVDWAQNDRVRSIVAPYSLRALPVPTVSAPLGWEEVERGEAGPFAPAEVVERLERHGDLFAPALSSRQRLG